MSNNVTGRYSLFTCPAGYKVRNMTAAVDAMDKDVHIRQKCVKCDEGTYGAPAGYMCSKCPTQSTVVCKDGLLDVSPGKSVGT